MEKAKPWQKSKPEAGIRQSRSLGIVDGMNNYAQGHSDPRDSRVLKTVRIFPSSNGFSALRELTDIEQIHVYYKIRAYDPTTTFHKIYEIVIKINEHVSSPIFMSTRKVDIEQYAFGLKEGLVKASKEFPDDAIKDGISDWNEFTFHGMSPGDF